MKAVSIRQPWAWAVCYAGKRVENRDWQPHGGNVAAARKVIAAGGTLFIHAGAGCTRGEYEDASYAIDVAVFRQNVVPPLATLPRGAIVARARLVDVVRTTVDGHRQAVSEQTTCALCGLRTNATCPKADAWAVPGSVGLILADVEPLPAPIPWKGALGFFEVPDVIGGAP